MAMPAAKGPISLAQDRIADALAALPSFREFAQAADEAEALAKIFPDKRERDDLLAETATKEELAEQRPFCVINISQPGGLVVSRPAQGASMCMVAMEVTLEADVSQAADADADPEIWHEVNRWWNNTCGTIIFDLLRSHDKVAMPQSAGINIWREPSTGNLGNFVACQFIAELGTRLQ